MYKHVWVKYLPIIKIILKRSATAGQTLAMNATDFQRAGAGRKVGYKFTLQFCNGRLDNPMHSSPVAKDLVATLLQDDMVKDLFRHHKYEIEMNTKFQLFIKCTPEAALEEPVLDEQHAVQMEG